MAWNTVIKEMVDKKILIMQKYTIIVFTPCKTVMPVV